MSETFINETISQLKKGLYCYVFSQEQVNVIKEKYEEKTGKTFSIEEKEDGYILLKPNERINESNYLGKKNERKNN